MLNMSRSISPQASRRRAMAGSCVERPMWRTLPSALRARRQVQQAAAHNRLGVLRLVHAVEEAKVRVFEDSEIARHAKVRRMASRSRVHA